MKVISDMAYAIRKRVIIVTGASRGLGRQIALSFGRAGDRIVVNYVSAGQQAAEVVNSIQAAGGEAIPFRADVRLAAEIEAMTAETRDRWGTIDVLINNAGVAKDCLTVRMPETDWNDVLDTNLKGAFQVTRSAANIMKENRDGHVINVSSIVGLHGREGQANYSASKAGLIGFTKACARELGVYNIKVNAVLPGYMTTELGNGVSSHILDRVLKDNALDRFSDPVEVAQFICHLSLMRNVSGQVFNLDSRIL